MDDIQKGDDTNGESLLDHLYNSKQENIPKANKWLMLGWDNKKQKYPE